MLLSMDVPTRRSRSQRAGLGRRWTSNRQRRSEDGVWRLSRRVVYLVEDTLMKNSALATGLGYLYGRILYRYLISHASNIGFVSLIAVAAKSKC